MDGLDSDWVVTVGKDNHVSRNCVLARWWSRGCVQQGRQAILARKGKQAGRYCVSARWAGRQVDAV